jgi:hypothetical protein
MAGAAGLVVLSNAPAEARSGEPLTIRTYDLAGVRDGEMQQAREAGSHVLEHAGLAVIWLDCTPPRPSNVLGPCDAPLKPREVVVRLMSAPASASPEALGAALVDVSQGRGVLATVFADRVRALAGQTTSVGRLLGRAAAHEVGHLLLGSVRHAPRGLMRGAWRQSEIRNEKPWEWYLDSREAARMRGGLVARERAAEGVVAGLRRVPAGAGLDSAADRGLELLDVFRP